MWACLVGGGSEMSRQDQLLIREQSSGNQAQKVIIKEQGYKEWEEGEKS